MNNEKIKINKTDDIKHYHYIRSRIKVNCDICDKCVSKKALPRHKRSKQCMNYI